MLRRQVFYLSGFDPRGARFYHSMHTQQLARRAERAGNEIAVSKRRRGAGMTVQWTVDNPEEGSTTRMTFLRWEDIVSRAWITGSLRFALRMTATYWNYLWRL